MKKNKDRIFISVIGTIIIIFLIITCFLWLANIEIFNWNLPIHYDAFGTFGDFWGGFIGTLVAILAAWYVFKTYRQSQEQHEKQLIESSFFEMLKVHQRNVDKLQEKDCDIFEDYTDILRSIYKSVKEFKESSVKSWSKEDTFKVAYLYFFYGMRNVKDAPPSFENRITSADIQEINAYFFSKNLEYAGCYLDLGIYFRQLFQMVSHINDSQVLSYKEKYNYIKNLRARLNINEQYLLFLNSMSTLGAPWEKGFDNKDNKLITKYNLLKNIPEEFPQIEDFDFRTEYNHIDYEYFGRWGNPNRKQWSKYYTYFFFHATFFLC